MNTTQKERRPTVCLGRHASTLRISQIWWDDCQPLCSPRVSLSSKASNILTAEWTIPTGKSVDKLCLQKSWGI